MCVETVHTKAPAHKKKLSTETTGEADDYSYNYLLSLFVTFFHYTVADFDQLTPVQASHILNTKKEVQSGFYEFFQNEFRTANFLNIKSGMAETKNIQKPSDLYKLPNDVSDKPSFDYSKGISAEDLAFIKKVISN